MKIVFRTLALGLLVSLAAACQAENATGKAADAVKAENAFIRAVPPGQANSAAFLTLINGSSAPHSLKSATSPVANTVELHTHTNNNGVMEMRQVPQIDVPAKGQVTLAPGGLHIMLIGLKQDLKPGETASVTLNFEDGSTAVVDAPIKEVTPPGGMNNH